MDDEEYAAALVQELQELSEAIVVATKDHEHAVDLLKSTRRDHLSLRRELEQRSAYNKSLLEQELLRQQIDSKKREKTTLLKELAAAKWNHEALQRAAGFAEPLRPASSEPNEDDRACLADAPHVPTSPSPRRRRPSTLKGPHPRHHRTSNLNGSFSSIDAFSASDSPESEKVNQRSSRKQRSSRNLSYSSLRASSFGDSASKLSLQDEEGVAVGPLSSGKCKRRSRTSTGGSCSNFNNSMSSLSTKSSSTIHTLRGRRKSGNIPFTIPGNEINQSVGGVRREKPLKRSASFDEVLACGDVSTGRLQRSCSLVRANATKERSASDGDVSSTSLGVEGLGHSNDSRALNGSKHPPKRMSLDDFSSDEGTDSTDDDEPPILNRGL